MADRPSRRQFIQITLGSLGAAAALSACKSAGPGAPAALACNDVTGLAPTDLQMRTTLGYEDKSADPAKKCANCMQFNVPATPNTCGSCKVMKGPINPDGNCKAWVAKPPV